jgi:hypothetical protein
MTLTLAQWLASHNAEAKINGFAFSDSNTFINVEVKQASSPYKRLEIKDRANYGRSNGTVDKLPSLEEALEDLCSILSGAEAYWAGNASYTICMPTIVLEVKPDAKPEEVYPHD